MTSPKPKLETLAVHAADFKELSKDVVPAIHLTTTYEREEDGSYPQGFVYTRSENPNRNALETALTALEGGDGCAAFSSGMAAISAVLQLLKSGDHVLISDDLYHGTRHIVNGIMARWGLEASYTDMTDVKEVATQLQDNTKLVWLETPSNPLLKIIDIEALSKLSHDKGSLVAVDATWTTPVVQRPLDLGADIVMHSTTKYLGGHSDILGGAVIVNDDALMEGIREIQLLGGAVPSPFDCWLLRRSLQSLPYRMRGHCENAMAVASFLEKQNFVQAVHYPGLESHPQHAVASKQMASFGGMMSLQIGDDETSPDLAMKLAANLKLIVRATSLGGVESLIEHRASIEGEGTTTPQNLLRVSIGLEHPDDLIADFAQALESL